MKKYISKFCDSAILISVLSIIVVFLTGGIRFHWLGIKFSLTNLNKGVAILTISLIIKVFFIINLNIQDFFGTQLKKYYPIIIVFFIYLTSIGILLKSFNGEITGFICLGDHEKYPQIIKYPDFIRGNAFIFKDSFGYDGFFYYYIAHDPFIQKDLFYYLDMPSFRYQRILYPLLVYITSLGNNSLMPYMMVMINLVFILGGMWLIIEILTLYGLSPWYSICFGLYPGLLLSVFRSLYNPVSIFFLLMGFYFYIKDKIKLSSLAFMFSLLAKESNLIFVFIIILFELFYRRFKKVIFLIYSIIPFILWQLYLYFKFNRVKIPFFTAGDYVSVPFTGIIEKINITFSSMAIVKLDWYFIFEWTFILLIIASVIIALVKIVKSFNLFNFLFLISVLIMLLFDFNIWANFWSYTRNADKVMLMMLLTYSQKQDKGTRILLNLLLLNSLFFILYFFNGGI
jgi:hypothetical protein